MRIWIVHQHAVPPITMGPTRHYDLAKKLIDQGHEVYIFAGNYCHITHRYIAEPYTRTQKITHYDTVPFIWLNAPAFRGNTLKRVWNMLMFAFNLRFFKDLTCLAQPDVIIGSSPSPFAAYAAAKIAQRLRIPFIYEIRDLWPETLLRIGGFNPYHPLIRIFASIEKKLAKQAAHIISVLPGVQEYFIQKKITTDPILWLPNFCELNHSTPPEPLSSEVLTILYTGSFNQGNDLETLLAAAKILDRQARSQFKFVLIGDGPKKAELQYLISSQQINNVELQAKVPKSEIFKIIKRADICVGLVKKCDLYKWGTSLNKIADYMACGRPVIFAVESPYNSIISANAGLVVAPEQPQQLADAILQLARLSPKEREQLGANGRLYALQHFNLERIASKLIDHLAAAIQ